ncbi:MAG: flagellar basal body P-ring protein FlgI [Pseudomonas formosensis]|nr:flagellar basal body P-ring protein FlgI [Halopseudomonas formosensis]
MVPLLMCRSAFMTLFTRALVLLLGLGSLTTQAGVPLMDLVDVEGIRGNQLIGYGLVVGLDGTGDRDQVKITGQSVTNMLQDFGVTLPANANRKLRNVAAVTVTAEVPPSYSPGQRVNVTVSSLGDAKSLRGGLLLMTPLRGVDGEIYAIAQGDLIVGGVNATGASGSSVAINSANTGLIPSGATVERRIPTDFAEWPEIMLNLRQPSFQTVTRIVERIDGVFGKNTAAALDATRVSVRAPVTSTQRMSFMAMLGELEIEAGRVRPRVVFNSRTGTVVVGQGVRVSAAAVAHGSLTVTVSENPQVSQPGAFSGGRTAVVPGTDIEVLQEVSPMFEWPEGASLETIISTVNSLGATPDDVMSILQSLERAGALNAELIVM